jgi:hypothetical protein
MFSQRRIYNLDEIKSVFFILYIIMSNMLRFYVYVLAFIICIYRVSSVIDYIEARYPLRVSTIFLNKVILC